MAARGAGAAAGDVEVDSREFGLAPSCGAAGDCFEHRLHVARGAADDGEHLGRCGLMLQGLTQIGSALAQLVEQRVFSMAMTAWLAKLLTNSTCLSVNGRTSWRGKL